MDHLHAVAAERGAPRVRLKVYRNNRAAIRLYESLAYEFEPFSETELLGFRSLSLLPAACSR
jgi:ribosomal protein S18 acetylase RimI-like enzyme